jgi:SAM-dependent methyltransferase
MTNANTPPLPANRTWEQLRKHYEVEKEIATRLKQATRAERRVIYATMYDELFERVPDHSRLQIREDSRLTAQANHGKWLLVKPFLSPAMTFVEFAPGSCRFAVEVCPHVRSVYGIDISDQTGQLASLPENFKLIIYDGYDLDMEPGIADIVFSDQLLEHFHPDDTELHLETVKRLLKPGGRYVFRTPHRHSGPHDVSAWFSENEPEGFHLKEWTYGEFDVVLRKLGFRSWRAYRLTKGAMVPVPMPILRTIENMIGGMPRQRRVWLARHLLKNITLVVQK